MTIWRPAYSLRGLYEVSDDGQIMRVATHGLRPKPIRRQLSPHKKPNGYLAADLQKDRTRHRSYVHRLVWESFRGAIPSGLEINHKNGIKSDNRLVNLELVTRSDNMLHGFRSLNFSRKRGEGESHHQAKLSEVDVAKILELRNSGINQKEVAKMFGVSKTAVHYIEIGRNWKHITGLG